MSLVEILKKVHTEIEGYAATEMKIWEPFITLRVNSLEYILEDSLILDLYRANGDVLVESLPEVALDFRTEIMLTAVHYELEGKARLRARPSGAYRNVFINDMVYTLSYGTFIRDVCHVKELKTWV